ncbi:putative receptor-like serine/threonine-protein kinase [Acorus gramineus]|uniref:non-specific serine/threonine protein kinase n=1 Tax=Acorus gramineus TaxID=55184 RepID=A0AAV8ZYL2_ACOGR|nr:putative receptor-like serine/threonine-protein kinase [Acorus gramineus]
MVSSGTRTESSADRGGGKGFAAAEEGRSGGTERSRSRSSGGCSSAASGGSAAEMAEMGWGRWYGRKELEAATEGFSRGNVIGEGGYGVVYRGVLGDNLVVAVKNLLNNFLLSAYSIAYLHEGLEPKVVHRDVKSSNILLDKQWNPKVSDFGLAKLLGPGSTFVTTRVMGTFGSFPDVPYNISCSYVAPEYASTGMLNERSDVYSFGVLMMELISGRTPVDYGRPNGEVNLVEWFKGMVANRRSEGVVDPLIETQPSIRSLKRLLVVCLRCTDLDSLNRPKMGQVVHMLEGDEFPYRSVSHYIFLEFN